MSKVLDNKHGIETQYLGQGKGYIYLPWYFRKGHTYYYTHFNNWERVQFSSYHDAYNFVARSRRLPTLPYSKEKRSSQA